MQPFVQLRIALPPSPSGQGGWRDPGTEIVFPMRQAFEISHA
jgi:hypothetical protein